jgi:hypothetical protein
VVVTKLRSAQGFAKLLYDSMEEFSACWASIKPDPDPARMDLLGFQPRLLRALQQLEAEYESIARTKRGLIRRKKRLTPWWFRARLRLLAKRQEVLRDAVTMGRTMGDSFAWLFYRDEHRLLDEHSAQEFVVPIPTGIGGQGELAFVSTMPGFAGHFVLHHGITTILRLGDVSLIDVARNRVVAIGELKTARPNEKELTIQVSLISAKGEEIDTTRVPTDHADRPEPPSALQLNPPALARLQRQLRKTEKALRPETDSRESEPVGVAGDSYIGELEKAIRRARRGRWITHRAGPGLLFVVYRSLSRKLDRRLREMTTTAASRLATGENPSKAVVPLIMRGSPHNLIVTTSVLYGAHGRPHHPRQAMPLVWLGVDRDLVFRLITLETQVITVYNPAHLYAAFQERGWEIEKGGSPIEVTLRRKHGESFLTLHGMDWFMRDVTLGLKSEEQIVNAVEIAVHRIRESGMARGTRVALNFRQVLPPLDGADSID